MDGTETPDESLDDLGRELRERVGNEMRQEAELLEQDAATVELRRRRIADVAIELAEQGRHRDGHRRRSLTCAVA